MGPQGQTPIARRGGLRRGDQIIRLDRLRSGPRAAPTAAVLLVVSALAFSEKPAYAATLPCSVQLGMYDTNTPWDPNETSIRNLDTAINRHSSIVHWFAQWGDNGAGNFSANQPWMLSNVRSYTSVGVTGSTPFITWEPWGPAPYTAGNNTFPLHSLPSRPLDPYTDSSAHAPHT